MKEESTNIRIHEHRARYLYFQIRDEECMTSERDILDVLLVNALYLLSYLSLT